MSERFDWTKHRRTDGAPFVHFNDIGDEIVGQIVAIRINTIDPKKGPVPLIDIARKSDGEIVTLSVDKVDLEAKIPDLEPQAGDMLAVRYVRAERTAGGGAKKLFAVRHKPGEAPPPPVDEPYGSEPFC